MKGAKRIDALKVRCPTCHAEPHKFCSDFRFAVVTKKDIRLLPATPHKARLDLIKP